MRLFSSFVLNSILRRVLRPAWIIAIIWPAVFSSPAQSDDATEQVVITATRSPQPRSITGESVSVISAADLQQEQTVVLTDIFSQIPGLSVTRTGGVGQTTTLSIRGAEAGQAVVLIDGVRINDPSTVDDEAVLGDVLANNIDRVEVLRGPQSTLYGSDAIGGVVDIISGRGGNDPFALLATAEGGSFDTYHINAAANGTIDALEYGAAVNFFHSNGISAADARNGNPETDGYTNFGATENVRYTVSNSMSVDVRTYFTDSRDDFDDNYVFLSYSPYFRVADSQAYGDDLLLANYVGVNFALLDGQLQNRIASIGTFGDRKTFPAPGEAEDFFARGYDHRLEYQGDLSVDPDNQMTFGAEYQHTALDTHSVYDSTPLTTGHDEIESGYAQWQSKLLDAVTLTGGARYDHDEEFGGHASGKAAGAWSLNEGTTVLHANYGTGFKAPTLYELDSEYSNPIASLQPETAQGWEAGAEQTLWAGRIQLTLTWFDRHTKDEIDFFTCYGPTSPACDQRYKVGGYYYNVGRARADGLETEAVFALSDTVKATLDYTNMTATDETTGADLARRPHVTADARIFWTPDAPYSLGASIGYVGRRWDDAGNTVPLDSNTLVNLYATYSLTNALQLFARVENLADVRYEPTYGYGAAGRAYYAGIRATY